MTVAHPWAGAGAWLMPTLALTTLLLASFSEKVVKEKFSDQIAMQCVECERIYHKPIQWVEVTPRMRCVCGAQLDVDQVFCEIVLEPKLMYLAFPRR
ncbi:hypothetical protein [Marinicella rhabdoformis]|uniref:hypothetical protein n=1 Tax=Marinicella rhabdoformis TaxID=2580566 RepID=UPI0012AEC3C9|nr:hypothetical protein [Marinicella rhabdoformis]